MVEIAFRPSKDKYTEAERAIRADFAALAAMPHMRPELRSLFRLLALPHVEVDEVRCATARTVKALRDVEEYVASIERGAT